MEPEACDAIAQHLIAHFGERALAVARQRALAHVEAGEQEGAMMWWAVADAIISRFELHSGA